MMGSITISYRLLCHQYKGERDEQLVTNYFRDNIW